MSVQTRVICDGCGANETRDGASDVVRRELFNSGWHFVIRAGKRHADYCESCFAELKETERLAHPRLKTLALIRSAGEAGILATEVRARLEGQRRKNLIYDDFRVLREAGLIVVVDREHQPGGRNCIDRWVASEFQGDREAHPPRCKSETEATVEAVLLAADHALTGSEVSRRVGRTDVRPILRRLLRQGRAVAVWRNKWRAPGDEAEGRGGEGSQ